jgi:hypothetical protein
MTLEDVLNRASQMDRSERWQRWTACGTLQPDSLPRTEAGGAKRPTYCPKCWTAFSADGVPWNPPCLPHELGCESWTIYSTGRPVMPGKYTSLYRYLENRYADTVVLTFAHIEGLLGFTLPDLARVHQEWCANNDPNATPSLIRDRGHWPAEQRRRTCRPRSLFVNGSHTDTCGDFLTRPSPIHPVTPTWSRHP